MKKKNLIWPKRLLVERLKLKKQKEYQEIFNSNFLQDQVYQNICEDVKNDIVNKFGLLALNVVCSINWALNQNNFSEESIEYLHKIKESDGQMTTNFYWNLVKSNKIDDDQLSLELIRILNNDYKIKKMGINYFGAFPENLESQPYKDDYIKLCSDSTREIMKDVLNAVDRKIKDDKIRKDYYRERRLSWNEKLTSIRDIPARTTNSSGEPVKKRRKVCTL